MDLNLVRAFVEIVEAGSLSEAARRRSVTRSHASKQLKTLERELGATLLRRSTRRLAPTDAGAALYEHGLRMLAECDAARASIDGLGRTARGHVRLSIPTGLAEATLAEVLLGFQRSHPGISLRVLFSNRVTDLIASEIDVAVRIVSEPPLGQVARDLGSVEWGLYAAPSYLGTGPPIDDVAALAAEQLLLPPVADRRVRLVLDRGAEPHELDVRPHLESEHFPFLRRAMLDGLGIALLPDYMANDDVAAGRAARVLPRWRPRGLGGRLCILTMPNRYPSHAARVLIEHLRTVLQPPDREAVRP